jgi:uncharacterized RDD family membrane protein YckC
MASKRCIACGQENVPEARFCAMCGSPLSMSGSIKRPSADYASSPLVPGEYVGFWLRSGAMIIDILTILALFFLLLLVPLLQSFSVALFFIILVLYFWLFTSLSGQTPGKMITGIRVVNKAGAKPGLVYVALREILGKITSVILISAGFFWIGWDDNKQGLHDKIAGTYVVMA